MVRDESWIQIFRRRKTRRGFLTAKRVAAAEIASILRRYWAVENELH